MKYNVNIIFDAEQDIFELYEYITHSDSPTAAEYVYSKIQEACLSLEEFPERGHFPPELERIGIRTYREIHFKPYRIIYQVTGKDVFIHSIIDGRRELQELLVKRLLRPMD